MVHSLQFCHPSRIVFDLPELLEVQRASFNRFLKQGVVNLFSEILPIRVEHDNLVFELLLDGSNYQLILPDDNPRDCILKMKTYSCKLYVKAKVVCSTKSGKTLETKKNEWMLVGHLPIMTKRGHFIINGSPRVIVHQVVRSPGIYFQQVVDKDETKRIRFYGDIIPFRGVWLRLQINKKGKVEAKLKKGKKVSAYMLQKCFQFIERHKYLQSIELDSIQFLNKCLIKNKQNRPLTSFAGRDQAKFALYNHGQLPPTSFQENNQLLELEPRSSLKRIQRSTKIASHRLGNLPTGLSEQNSDKPACFAKAAALRTEVFNSHINLDKLSHGPGQENKALLYTYNKLYRPVEDKEKEEISRKSGNNFFQQFLFADNRLKLKRCYKNLSSTFKEKKRYDLSDIGRQKINKKLGITVFETELTALDIKAASYWLHKLTKGEKDIDDIDHFQNRRIRTSGELLQIQFENGIDRLTKLAWNKLKENVSSQSAQKSTTKNSFSQQHHNGDSINKNRNILKSHLFAEFKQKRNKAPTKQRAFPRFNNHFQKPKPTWLIPGLSEVSSKIGIYQPCLAVCALVRFASLAKQASEAKQAKQSKQGTHIKAGNLLPSHIKFKKRIVSYKEPLLKSILLKDLLSTKPINGALRELFGTNPLSQYMDQTNPLAEITHKRRMSSLGVGGVNRESAGMAIRGIHPTHYGRICPIETPEGKNAGLVNSLAFYSKINDKGFVETPYYKVVKGQVQQELGFTFFSAKRESISHFNIAPSDLQQSWNNKFTNNSVPVRIADNLLDLFQKTRSNNVNCIGVSPIQMISVATSLIPFLEHNDANRALMGSNMQRQAVPLMIPERPIVGTGLESLVVAESGHVSQAELTGFVSYVSANKIVIESLDCLQKKTSNSKIFMSERTSNLAWNEVTRRHSASLRSLPCLVCLASLACFDSLWLLAKQASEASKQSRQVSRRACEAGRQTGWYSKTKGVLVPHVFKIHTRYQKKSLRNCKKKEVRYAALCNQIAKTNSYYFNSIPVENHDRIQKCLHTKCASTNERGRQSKQPMLGPSLQIQSRFNQQIISPSDCKDRLLCALLACFASEASKRSKAKQSKHTSRLAALSSMNLCRRSLALTPCDYTNKNKKEVQHLSPFVRWSAALALCAPHTSGQAPLSYEAKQAKQAHKWTSPNFAKLRFVSYNSKNSYSVLPLQTHAGQYKSQQLIPSVHLIDNFARSNQDTCLMQRVSAKEGDWVQKGDILTDCSASDKGELSVGKNVLVAYMPWEGYNFEDAIVINERLVKEHVYTSLHIERYDLNAQDVKEGNEWFTKDLPGIQNKKVKHLDEFGLPKIGSFVQEGDILIGKMRYSNKKPTTPYERLLCDILGENNFSARDSSLYVPKGVNARVIKHKILAFFEDPYQKADFRQILSRQAKTCQTSFLPTDPSYNLLTTESNKQILPKIVHIFLGEKRAIQIGDKMSGRHGNKGVVATILPKQDMPYLPDGTPVDIILNPLGVPSRMNVGQVFEALLGLAGTYLAQHFKLTAFDELYGVEASQSLVYLKLYQARLQSGQNWLFQVDFPGKTRLIDGRSGQCFDQWVTVGRAYILKLIHMVNEKIHARATGPYALITQQPLRGRSQKGGQRLGEMEVWALEGFGAAYTLQELLTKKSDDIVGRKEVASSILPRPFSIFDKIQNSNRRQENRLILGQPEIFKVLICELQALCLDVGVYSLTTKSFKRSFLDKIN